METNTSTPTAKVHHGRNIKRLREMLGVKQEFIASELEMTQQTISKLEQKDEIDDKVLGEGGRCVKSACGGPKKPE